MNTPPKKKIRVKPPKVFTPQQEAMLTEYVSFCVPELHKTATERVLHKQLARSAAIRIKCLQCCNYERAEVAYCPVITCALHAVRPYTGKVVDEEAEDDAED